MSSNFMNEKIIDSIYAEQQQQKKCTIVRWNRFIYNFFYILINWEEQFETGKKLFYSFINIFMVIKSNWNSFFFVF